MRITQQATIRTTLWNLSTKQTELAQLQEQLATQKRINRPSDDPAGAARLLSLQTQINQIDRFVRNANTVKARLDASATALQSGNDLLVQARQLVLSAANSSVTQSERCVIAGQIGDILTSLVAVGNTQQNGRYLFSGTATATPALELGDLDSASPVTYRGNDQAAKQYINFQTQVEINQPGNEVFHAGEAGDVFALLSSVRNLLMNRDSLSETQQITELSSVADELQGASDNLPQSIGSLGHRSATIEKTLMQLSESKLVLEKLASETGDADFSELIVKFNDQQNALQAALLAASELIRPTLVDALK